MIIYLSDNYLFVPPEKKKKKKKKNNNKKQKELPTAAIVNKTL